MGAEVNVIASKAKQSIKITNNHFLLRHHLSYPYFIFAETKLHMGKFNLQHHEMNLFENAGSYINGMRLYFAYFKKTPSIIRLDGISSKKIKSYLEIEHKDDIKEVHQKRSKAANERKLSDINIIFCMNDNIFIDLEKDTACIIYHTTLEAKANEWYQKIRKFTLKNIAKKTTEISLIRQSRYGISTTNIKLKKPKLNLSKNYNDDLKAMHQMVTRKLQQKDKSGIILFYGSPGTGKSTYIRFLVHQLKKKVIFMSPKIAGAIDSPDFTDFLIDNANTVFVIEDAEQLITSRDNNYNSSISMLLNITDGLLGECLGIQIIATFNTHVSNIDKALLRKGRLIGLYEFKPLSIQKSKILLEENGNTNSEIKQPMTLADIYNTEQTEFSFNNNKRASIGFTSGVN